TETGQYLEKQKSKRTIYYPSIQSQYELVIREFGWMEERSLMAQKAQHAILRFAKHKAGPAGALEAHHERTKEKYASNPDIDISKSKDNFHIIQPTQKYRKEIDTRIKAAGCRTRKDSTMFVDTLITASPEFFTGRSKKEVQAY